MQFATCWDNSGVLLIPVSGTAAFVGADCWVATEVEVGVEVGTAPEVAVGAAGLVGTGVIIPMFGVGELVETVVEEGSDAFSVGASSLIWPDPSVGDGVG